MTLAEAKVAILEHGCFVTRKAWIDARKERFLVRHGDYSKPTEELWSGPLKEVVEFYHRPKVEFQVHIDCIEITEDAAKLHIGYDFSNDDIWADDYHCVHFDDEVSVDDLCSHQKNELAEAILNGTAVVENPDGTEATPEETEAFAQGLKDEAANDANFTTPSDEEQPEGSK